MPKLVSNQLTVLKVKAIGQPGVYADGGGLYLQVTPTGARSWLFRYMLGGKARAMGLGPVRDVSLKDARALAHTLRGKLRDGIDPLDEKERERAAARAKSAATMTFKQAAQWYIESKASEWSNEKHAAQWASTLDKYAAPVLGDLDVSKIGTDHVLRVLQPIWHTKNETASRVRGRIENILDAMTARRFRDGDNPARWKGHLDKLLPKRSSVRAVEHHRALPYAQSYDFMQALGTKVGVSARCLEFTMLNACRTIEVTKAEWGEFDFNRNEWTIPAARMKTRKEHKIPLSAAALKVLERVKGLNEKYAFPGDKKGSHLSDAAMAKLVKDMRDFDTTPHGLRATFRTWAGECTHHAWEICEVALSHKVNNETQAAYNRGELLDKRRVLMEDWTMFIGTLPVRPVVDVAR